MYVFWVQHTWIILLIMSAKYFEKTSLLIAIIPIYNVI